MTKESNKLVHLWQELKRRKVPRTLAIYAGTAFIILETVDIIFPLWGFPDWSVSLILYLLILGAIITVIISWIYDITPTGIVKTEDITDEKEILFDKPPGKLTASNIIIAVLVIVVGVLLYPKILKNDNSPLGGTNRSTIAVIPLKIIGDESDVNYFASGLVESMTYMLSKIGNAKRAFSVIPASEILKTISADEARKQYGASLIISGSIQINQGRTRLILNLIETKTQHLLRSEKLDYFEDSNILIQDEAISLMTKMLDLKIESETKAIFTSSGSRSGQANEFYLRAKGCLLNSQSLQDVDIAIELFKSAIKEDSLFAMAFAGLGQAFWSKYAYNYETQYADSAIQYTKKALQLNDKDPIVLIALGSIYRGKGEYDSAFKILQKAINLDPNNEEGHIQTGRIYTALGKFDKAEKFYKDAISLKPDYWRCYSHLGVSYYYNGLYDKAIEQFKLGLQIALNALGGSYWQLQKLDEAIATFEHIIKINPKKKSAIANLGTAYFYNGNFKKASQKYEEVLNITPNDYNVLGYLGEALYWSGEKEKAYDCYKRAIALAKENLEYDPKANLEIAFSYGFLGMKDSVLHYLRRSNIPDDPKNADTYTALAVGEIYVMLGNHKTAVEWIESAIMRDYGWIQLKFNPLFEEILKNSDFQQMIAKYKSAKE